ncbi:MAG: outer membrane protein assembly factor BamA [Bacteroidales bacterium]|nr:outer membrane protein assembly factor BamA [Bacteroidales bacterium]
MKRILYVLLFSLLPALIFAQGTKDKIINIDYKNPRTYEIAAISVSGVQYLQNSDIVIMLSGLSVGQKIKIPGDELSSAIEKIFKQGLFEEVEISVTAVQGDFIYLDIYLQERPVLSKFSFTGVNRNEADNLKEKIGLARGDVVSENTIMTAKRLIRSHFVDKGFLNAKVDVVQRLDTAKGNQMILDFVIDKGKKVKIGEISIAGNEAVEDAKIMRSMKETKRKKIYRVFKASKFTNSEYEKDKQSVIAMYNELGYRDAVIVSDSTYNIDDKTMGIALNIDEGQKYYFGNIHWVGNSKYSDKQLGEILGIQKGDIYNQRLLESNLYMNMNGRDITSLYMDDGYLFFSVTPIELTVTNDTIDMEMQIYEGKQATINKVSVSGNTRTNDHVIMREIRTKPGQLFRRSDIIRTQRELAQMRYFNPEALNVIPVPNPADGTVDIEYVVEETSTDQLELSGGWGLGRLVGTLGVSFNNFSLRNIFKKGSWRPLPTGDGQKLSLRAQSNGLYYQSYNMSFTEPWLGGKKPNAFSVSVYNSVQTNGITKKDDGTYNEYGTLLSREEIKITGVTVGLGRRLKWPDDFFMFYTTVSYQHYMLDDYYSAYSFTTGNSNNLNLGFTLTRNSIDAPIYPKTGSEVTLMANFTPPYSLFNNNDYTTMSDEDKYKWLEYHKWKFNMTWYTKLAGDLVFMSRAKMGFLGLYNRDIGISPFERFYLGGDGLSGFALDGREIIGMRGYDNSVLTARDANNATVGGTIYSKYTFELRYPLSTNPMATIYMLGFLEAGNTWAGFKEYEPFNVKRSAGIGVRIYLPMFGLLGLDYGIPFDEIPGIQQPYVGQFHFSINSSID